MTDITAKTRLADYKADISAVLQRTRPLAIVEHIKSPEAYKQAYSAGSVLGMIVWTHSVLSSNGEIGPAIALCHDLGVLSRYQHLRNNAREFMRQGYQRRMGELLGYDGPSIRAFIGSDIAQRCPCELCGGRAHANRTELDAYKARILPQISSHSWGPGL